MARDRDILAYRNCRSEPRSARAAEGAILGAAVGLVSGAIMGGLVLAMSESKRTALIVSLGVFGFAVVGQAAVSALPPECGSRASDDRASDDRTSGLRAVYAAHECRSLLRSAYKL